jgi:putative DNA primase/helicase
VGNAEATAMLRQVRGFLEAHGDARFTWVQRVDDDHAGRTMHRAGFKRCISEDRPVNSDREYVAEYGQKMGNADAERSDTEYLILTEPFRKEVCGGFDHRAVARLLADVGALRSEGSGRFDCKVRIGSLGQMRAYRIQSSIFSLDID